jgi:hypothetical protein
LTSVLDGVISEVSSRRFPFYLYCTASSRRYVMDAALVGAVGIIGEGKVLLAS